MDRIKLYMPKDIQIRLGSSGFPIDLAIGSRHGGRRGVIGSGLTCGDGRTTHRISRCSYAHVFTF